MLKVVRDGPEGQADELGLSLDDLAREGARRMLAIATCTATGTSTLGTIFEQETDNSICDALAEELAIPLGFQD